MAFINFNAADVDPNQSFEPIPAGKYVAAIVDSTPSRLGPIILGRMAACAATVLAAILGAIWAALAVAKGLPVQKVPVAELQKTLLGEGAVFTQGVDVQLAALARIRAKFEPARRNEKAPWARKERK